MLCKSADEITGLLVAWRRGDHSALASLMPLTYRSLKEIAGRLLQRERHGHTLQTTALVHEAYLRLLDLEKIDWRDRVHFFAMCARIMRRVLVDHARHRTRIKRGGDALRLSIDDLPQSAGELAPEIVALDEALQDLAKQDKERAQLVELRYFGGLDGDEIAEVMGVSRATVNRRWRSARAWLLRYLNTEAV